MTAEPAGLRPKPSEAQRLTAEFVGTFFLTFVAAGADVVESTSGGQIGHVAHYLAPGLLVTAMIWSISAVSGAHINPAVTFAFVVRGSFPIARAVGYWIAQLAASVCAALVLHAFFGAAIARGVTEPGAGVTRLGAATWELLLTLLLVSIILGTSEEAAVVGKNAALAVGFTVALCGLFSSPVSGASMNPARSFGPALVAGRLSDVWIYFVGPLLGSLAAVGLAYIIHGRPTESERAAAHGRHR